MPKNIVICIDGTENQIEVNISNVLKLYRVADQDDKQIVYYDQGIGTVGLRSTWKSASQERIRFLDSAFGHTLDAKVIEAYRFLVYHYQRGDKLFFFGFSRGAHAVRVLAGMIYLLGILKPSQQNLCEAAYSSYKMASLANDETEALNFKRISKAATVEIEFLGLWDTVSSVFRPKSKSKLSITRQSLLHTDDSPAVKVIRHAMAIDEKRRMFRVDRWMADGEFKANRFAQGEADAQDLKEVWFAGCHSDVGGGYARKDSALSQIAFLWMVKEAMAFGLEVHDRIRKHVGGIKVWDEKTRHTYPVPTHLGKIHNSMTAKWAWMEFAPKNNRYKEWEQRWSLFGRYIPRNEPRLIKEGDLIHQSAIDRKLDKSAKYNPANFPASPNVEHESWAVDFGAEG